MRTREQWLEQATKLLSAKMFKPLGYNVPKVRLSVGFTGARDSQKVLGAHWAPEASSDKVGQIFIAPQTDDSISILATLVHELVHATVGNKAGHGPKFRKVAEAVGLDGKMTATTASAELVTCLNAFVIKELGEIPHAALNPRLNPKKKQGTRLIKIFCPRTEYNARITKKWILEIGTPLCPCCSECMKFELPKDAEEE